MWQENLKQIIDGNRKTLARCISLVENEADGYEDLLMSLPVSSSKIIGITGPPGAGKSTLVDSLIGLLVKEEKNIAVLCIDPSSPFNLGALLGDRIRMSNWYNHPNVFIRSLASRGSLGGLHPKIIEITDLMKAAAFDYVIVETVGVGQSEIEIAGLADITVVVVVPEAGDEIQTMKAGLMEIADIFVVNKADRPDADLFVKNLRLMLAPAFHNRYDEVPVLKTIASQNTGVHDRKDRAGPLGAAAQDHRIGESRAARRPRLLRASSSGRRERGSDHSRTAGRTAVRRPSALSDAGNAARQGAPGIQRSLRNHADRHARWQTVVPVTARRSASATAETVREDRGRNRARAAGHGKKCHGQGDGPAWRLEDHADGEVIKTPTNTRWPASLESPHVRKKETTRDPHTDR